MSADELEIEVDDGQVRFRLVDGTPLGIGLEERVVPALRRAFDRLGDPETVVEGMPGCRVCTLEVTGGELLLGRTAGGAALLWRDGDSLLGRVDFSDRTGATFVEWLDSLRPPPPEDGWRERRTAVLEAIEDVVVARRGAEEAGATSEEIGRLRRRVLDLRQQYVEDLPQRPIARDPFGGSIVTAAVDTAGLDGPFWDAQDPARRAEVMPPSFVVLTGAMRLSRLHLEHTPHLCLPGPQAPFVVPALLGRDGVKAVLATVPVGPHIGYAVSYFTPRDSEPPPLPNEWGRREHWLRERGRPLTMSGSFDVDPSPDVDLRPWIDRAKLAWVAPGDAAMRLRWALPGCPYLTWRGPYRHQRVQAGEIL